MSESKAESYKDLSSYIKSFNGRPLQFRLIQENEIIYTIKNLKTTKSIDIHGLSINIIKDASVVIANSLTIIFDMSILQGVSPEHWKISIGKFPAPIYKSGIRKECSNYTAISVIANIPKIFEKLIYNQISDHFESNSLLTHNQSGFGKGHSTSTSLLHATNQWYTNIDKDLINRVLFLDLKKTYDTINHAILLKKLKSYGISRISLKWFKSYLKGRKQFCRINSSTSDAQSVTCGIPQGSNLGPILFLIYVNDLPNCLNKSKASMFADDTSLSTSAFNIKDVEMNLNEELQMVDEWLTVNKLTLNSTKTTYDDNI